MDSRWARVARGGTAAAFATFVAALSHTLAGGATPSAFGVVVSFVLASTACTLLAGRSLSLLRLAVSVALSQTLFHSVFSGLGAPVASSALEHHGASGLTGAAGPSAALDSAALHSTALHSTAVHSTMPGATMILAHLVAGLVTILVFRYAESAFWGLATTFRLFLSRLLGIATVVPLAVRAAPRKVGRLFPHDREPFLSSMRRRGPPQGSLAV